MTHGSSVVAGSSGAVIRDPMSVCATLFDTRTGLADMLLEADMCKHTDQRKTHINHSAKRIALIVGFESHLVYVLNSDITISSSSVGSSRKMFCKWNCTFSSILMPPKSFC